MADYYALAQAIDRQPRTVIDWEANFLESILRLGPRAKLSPKQKSILQDLAITYQIDTGTLEGTRYAHP